MKSLFTLAAKHGVNMANEAMYLKFGVDRTRPVFFYALSTEKCNVKCISCGYWKRPVTDELSIDEWKKALLSVKEFVGRFSISFSGGEPLTKKGFLDLIEFCGENGINAGFTTNGLALSKKVVERIVAAQPFNVNISVDGPTAEIHDYLRGYPGLFERLNEGVGRLVKERAQKNLSFPVTIKPTINAVNFESLPAIVEWAKNMEVTAVNFQPVTNWDWTPEIHDELWIKEDKLPRLSRVMDRLIEMKKNGDPILTSVQSLELVVPHFRGEKAPKENLPCKVGLSYMYIEQNGNIKICPRFPVIGNLRENTARDIWYGETGKKIRQQTINCDRLCLLTCILHKSMVDRVKLGMKLFNPLSNKNKNLAKIASADSLD